MKKTVKKSDYPTTTTKKSNGFSKGKVVEIKENHISKKEK